MKLTTVGVAATLYVLTNLRLLLKITFKNGDSNISALDLSKTAWFISSRIFIL
jgi:hypothetical protein